MRNLFIAAALLVCLAVPTWAGSLPDAPSFTAASSQIPNAMDVAKDEAQNVLTIQPPPEVVAARQALKSIPSAVEFGVKPGEPKRKVMDRNFLLLAGLTFALTTADIELTQHCLKAKTCVELNPTLPLSRWGMYAVNTPVNLAVLYLSYRRKAAGKGDWWIAPVVDIGIHGVGIGSNVRFAW
ncbi:MAG TPA: hypothetical protein VD837_12870 [Terriglobales bacterium]|nr:hypothetical protein [Terriglobales bacterium]